MQLMCESGPSREQFPSPYTIISSKQLCELGYKRGWLAQIHPMTLHGSGIWGWVSIAQIRLHNNSPFYRVFQWEFQWWQSSFAEKYPVRSHQNPTAMCSHWLELGLFNSSKPYCPGSNEIRLLVCPGNATKSSTICWGSMTHALEFLRYIKFVSTHR